MRLRICADFPPKGFDVSEGTFVVLLKFMSFTKTVSSTNTNMWNDSSKYIFYFLHERYPYRLRFVLSSVVTVKRGFV